MCDIFHVLYEADSNSGYVTSSVRVTCRWLIGNVLKWKGHGAIEFQPLEELRNITKGFSRDIQYPGGELNLANRQ